MSKFTLSAFADEIDESLNIQMDVLDRYDIKYIEMRGVDGKGVVEYTLHDIKEIKKKLDDRGFKVSAVGSPIGKISITDEFEGHLDLFKHTLSIANILETKYIRMFSFFIPKGKKASDFREEVISRWFKFVDAARDSGIILLHENEKEIYGDTPERCLDLLNTLGCEYVRATFDPANFVQCDVETFPHGFSMLKEHIEYMHIKDALFSDHRVVPAGQGDGRVEDILNELNKSGYEGFLSIEPHLGNFNGFSSLETGDVPADLPDGGPKQFAVAYNALYKIISNMER